MAQGTASPRRNSRLGRFDWNKLLAKTERTADGYPFSSWDVICDRVRLVYVAQEQRWEYRRWKQRKHTPKAERPRCEARTRQGTPCQARAVEGHWRCRMHGGR